MPVLFTIQGDDVYWNGQLVAKITVPVSTLRDVVEDRILENDYDEGLEDGREEGYHEGYDGGYEKGLKEGYRIGREEQD